MTDPLLEALRASKVPPPEERRSPLPSAREIDAELARKYGAPKPPIVTARGKGRAPEL